MLDIINDVRVLDFSYVYIPDINGILNTLLYERPSKDFASQYAKSERSLNAKIDQLIKSYDKLEELLDKGKNGIKTPAEGTSAADCGFSCLRRNKRRAAAAYICRRK